MGELQNFSMYRGCDYTLRFTVEGTGSIAGWTISFWVRANAASEDFLIEKTTAAGGVVITDPANRIFTVSLEDTDTDDLAVGPYFIECKRMDVGLEQEIATGTLTLVPVGASLGVTTLAELRRELSKRIGLYQEDTIESATVTTAQLTNTADADGHYDNSWLLPQDTAPATWERRVSNYAGRIFTVAPPWSSGPTGSMEVHQFRPRMLTDLLNWARGDAFPNVGILKVELLAATGGPTYTIPGTPAIVNLRDVCHKIADSSDWVNWRPVAWEPTGDGVSFTVLEHLPDSATLRVRGVSPLSALVDEDDEIELVFPQTEILYAAAALRLYNQAFNLVPYLTEDHVKSMIKHWRGWLAEMRMTHSAEKPIRSAQIPEL